MTAEEKRNYAALCYALGWTRGQLSDVLDGDASMERVREIYEASSTVAIAAAIGKTEADLSCDWNEHLTEQEKWIISGRHNR